MELLVIFSLFAATSSLLVYDPVRDVTRCSGEMPFFGGAGDLSSRARYKNSSTYRFKASYKSQGLAGITQSNEKMLSFPPYNGAFYGDSPLNVISPGKTATIVTETPTMIAVHCQSCTITAGSIILEKLKDFINVESGGKLLDSVKVEDTFFIHIAKGVLKVENNIYHSQDSIKKVDLQGDAFIQYNILKGTFLLHSFGGKDTFSVKFSQADPCIQFKYTSKVEDIQLQVQDELITLPIASDWTLFEVDGLIAPVEFFFKLPPSTTNPDFLLALHFSPCHSDAERTLHGKQGCISHGELTEIGTLHDNECPGRYGSACEKMCLAEWIICGEKCYTCFNKDSSLEILLVVGISFATILIVIAAAVTTGILCWRKLKRLETMVQVGTYTSMEANVETSV